MQNFHQRTLFYASRVFSNSQDIGQGYYKLKPIYYISILCEPLLETEFKELDELVLFYRMFEKTHKCFAPDGINIIFARVYLAPKQYGDCQTDIEKLFWIFNSKGNAIQSPEELAPFTALAKASEYANYQKDKLDEYLHDVMNAVDYEINLHESHEKGFNEAKFEVAKALLSNGVSMEIISKSIGLSIEGIKATTA